MCLLAIGISLGIDDMLVVQYTPSTGLLLTFYQEHRHMSQKMRIL